MIFFDRTEFIALLISLGSESLFGMAGSKIFTLNWRLVTTAAMVGTLITHPILWQLFLYLSPHLSFVIRSLLLEFLVVIFECLVYRIITGYRWQTCVLLSGGANFCSYSLGLLLVR